MQLFTLIHISLEEESIQNNFVTGGTKAQIALYINCACRLAESLAVQGLSLTVITNDREYILTHLANPPFAIVQLPFVQNVPSGIRFYSAHYKLQVFKYLAGLDSGYLCLIDSDIVCVNKVPVALRCAAANQEPLFYDITRQVVPKLGVKTIVDNKQRLINDKCGPTWAGGEFLAGPPSFFAELSELLVPIEKRYFSNFQSFVHQGDEMVVTAAIEKLRRRRTLEDAGLNGIITRYWSVRPIHQQGSVDKIKTSFLIHLPSDKPFLAGKPFTTPDEFLKRYERYVDRKRVFRFWFGPFIPALKTVLISVPKMSRYPLTKVLSQFFFRKSKEYAS
ncbi:hypothetical protein [Pedobacter sp. SYSU D00535]|uniref:hypothetical protein n=1 Tax=Pedobacter sp. SYSU D00535 TaxID=2810308 RepID=UPI001A97CBC2|nr:hypothetical protein [Pedobacter sp. SYSU D00535]